MRPLRRGATPYYHQIEAILRDQVVSGELRIGDRMPSEQELCLMFGVSRPTVRLAMQKLVLDGIVLRERGRGTFVVARPEGIAGTRLDCGLDALVGPADGATIALLRSGAVLAPSSVCEALELTEGSDAFSFVRLVSVAAKPFLAAKVHVAMSVGERLNAADLIAPDLLGAIAGRCGVRIVEAEQAVDAIMADARMAGFLDVEPGAALLSVRRTSYDRAHRPIEHSHTVYRGDRGRFRFTQRRSTTKAAKWRVM